MPTRVQRLKKRSTKVADKAVEKMKKIGGYPTSSNRSGKVLNKALKKGRKIDRKIIKVRARNLNRADKKDDRVAKRAAKPKRRVVTKGKTNSGAKVKTVVVKKKDGTVKRTRSVVSGKGIKRDVVDSRRPNKGRGKMKRQVRRTYRKTGTL